MTKAKYIPLTALAGVDKDNTSLQTQHYTSASRIRFYDGKPRKLGGNVAFTFSESNVISGCSRTVYSQVLNNTIVTLIGTNTRLYAVIGSDLTNITPLVAATTAIANSLDTNYQTLGSDPATTVISSADVVIASTAHVLVTGDTVTLSGFGTDTTLGTNPLATTNTSTTVTVTHTSHPYSNGDTVNISGVPSAVNGIPADELNAYHTIGNESTNAYDITVTTAATSTGSGGGTVVVAGLSAVPASELNASHIVRATTINTYTITVTTVATSSGAGGGASVVEATAVITVNQSTHGFAEGDRVKILAAASTGGIPDSEINIEHIIRNSQTNTYDIVATTRATSSVTGGGGASTTVQGQISSGNCDGGAGIGYGVGKYGTGLYGVSKTSTNNITFPRIWSFDRFGSLVIMTAGGQTGLYSWAGATGVAPALVTNAPTAIDYTFESNNIAVTLGEGGVPNRIKWSDQGLLTTWTGTSQNQAGEDDIEGADKFISHAESRNGDVLFTNGRKIILMQYIDRPTIWKFTTIPTPDSLIAQNARVSVNGIVYWMGLNNLWEFNGGVIRPIQSNSPTRHNYVRRYIYDDINTAQQTKAFAWYNSLWDEVWFHYPSSDSNECDRVIRYSLGEKHLTPDEDFNRTAAEAPFISNTQPRLIGTDNVMYRHELGLNDDTSTLDWSLTFPQTQIGNVLARIDGIVPDSTQTGDIGMVVKGRPYPQSSTVIYAQTDGTASTIPSTFTVSSTTDRTSVNFEARVLEVTLSQTSVTDGDWIMGAWNAEVVRSTSERSGQ